VKVLWLLIAAALAVALAAAAGSGRAGGSANVRAQTIATGLAHSCAITTAGGVKCWGYNGHDELGSGRGDDQNNSTPVDVSGLSSGVTAVAVGVRHSCAVTSAGGVKCWGAAYSGALGDGTAERRWAPVDVSGLSSGVTAVAAGHDDSCALTSAGGVKCWGENTFGELGDGTTVDRMTPVDVSGLSGGVIAIAAGVVHNCALTNGGVKCWGGHQYGSSPVDISGLNGGVAAITSSCALTSAGGVKCWGGDSGLLAVDVPGVSSGVTAIAGASSLYSCALTSRGGVKCWGDNEFGQLGNGTTSDSATPVNVSGLSRGVTAIAAAHFHSCALVRAGGLKCWGGNSTGQLGDGTRVDRPRPVSVIGFGPKAAVAVVSPSVRVTPARVAAVNLRCGGQARCRGTLTLTASVNSKVEGIRVKLGSHSFSIAAGQAHAVDVKLNARGFKLLVRAKRLKTDVSIKYKQPDGTTTTRTRTITLITPKR
jgi:hypothetical protein